MDFLWVGIGIVVLFLLSRFVLVSFRNLIVNIVVGLIVLYGINTFGSAFGLPYIPITLVTGILIGIFGFPGVLVITLYYTFF